MSQKPRSPRCRDGGSKERIGGTRENEAPRQNHADACANPLTERRRGDEPAPDKRDYETPTKTHENPSQPLKPPVRGAESAKQGISNQTATHGDLSGMALYEWINTATNGFTAYPRTLVQKPRELLLALRMCWAVTIPELHEVFHGRRRTACIYIPKRKREAGAFLKAVEYHFKEFQLHSKPETVKEIFTATWKIYQGEYEAIPAKKLCFTVNEQRLRRLYDELQAYTEGLRCFPDWVLIISPLYLFLIQMMLGASREEYAEILGVHDEDEVSRILHGRRWYTDRKLLRRTIRRQIAEKLHKALKAKPATWETTLQNFRKHRNHSCGDMGSPTQIRRIAPMRISELELETLKHLEPLEKEFPDIAIVQQDRLNLLGRTRVPDLTIRRQGRLEAIIECVKLRTRLNEEKSVGEIERKTKLYKKAYPATAVIVVFDSFTNNGRVLRDAKETVDHADGVFTREELGQLRPYARQVLTDPDFKVNIVRIERIPRSQLLSQTPSSLFFTAHLLFHKTALRGAI